MIAGSEKRDSSPDLFCREVFAGKPVQGLVSSAVLNLYPERSMPRLLFCSYHCYWDQSSGAALCTRGLLELWAQRGWSCRVFCGPHLDFEDTPSIAQILAAQQIPFYRIQRENSRKGVRTLFSEFRKGSRHLFFFFSSFSSSKLRSASRAKPNLPPLFSF